MGRLPSPTSNNRETAQFHVLNILEFPKKEIPAKRGCVLLVSGMKTAAEYRR